MDEMDVDAIKLGAESDIGSYVAGFKCPGCGLRTCGVASRFLRSVEDCDPRRPATHGIDCALD